MILGVWQVLGQRPGVCMPRRCRAARSPPSGTPAAEVAGLGGKMGDDGVSKACLSVLQAGGCTNRNAAVEGGSLIHEARRIEQSKRQRKDRRKDD